MGMQKVKFQHRVGIITNTHLTQHKPPGKLACFQLSIHI